MMSFFQKNDARYAMLVLFLEQISGLFIGRVLTGVTHQIDQLDPNDDLLIVVTDTG